MMNRDRGMDSRKIAYENKKVIKQILEHNKIVGEKNAQRINDQEGIVLKDTLRHLEKRIPKNLSDAMKKTQEVLDYYKPSWAEPKPRTSKSFFFSFGNKTNKDK